jgi:hypothetical protein
MVFDTELFFKKKYSVSKGVEKHTTSPLHVRKVTSLGIVWFPFFFIKNAVRTELPLKEVVRFKRRFIPLTGFFFSRLSVQSRRRMKCKYFLQKPHGAEVAFALSIEPGNQQRIAELHGVAFEFEKTTWRFYYSVSEQPCIDFTKHTIVFGRPGTPFTPCSKHYQLLELLLARIEEFVNNFISPEERFRRYEELGSPEELKQKLVELEQFRAAQKTSAAKPLSRVDVVD